MQRILGILTLVVLVTPPVTVAQDFSGRHSMQSPEGTVVNLQGQTKGTEAYGIASIGEKSILFKLHHRGQQLSLHHDPGHLRQQAGHGEGAGVCFCAAGIGEHWRRAAIEFTGIRR